MGLRKLAPHAIAAYAGSINGSLPVIQSLSAILAQSVGDRVINDLSYLTASADATALALGLPAGRDNKQHDLSSLIDAAAATSNHSKAGSLLSARLACSQLSNADEWLTTLPVPGCRLSSAQFSVAVRAHLGLKVIRTSVLK